MVVKKIVVDMNKTSQNESIGEYSKRMYSENKEFEKAKTQTLKIPKEEIESMKHTLKENLTHEGNTVISEGEKPPKQIKGKLVVLPKNEDDLEKANKFKLDKFHKNKKQNHQNEHKFFTKEELKSGNDSN